MGVSTLFSFLSLCMYARYSTTIGQPAFRNGEGDTILLQYTLAGYEVYYAIYTAVSNKHKHFYTLPSPPTHTTSYPTSKAKTNNHNPQSIPSHFPLIRRLLAPTVETSLAPIRHATTQSATKPQPCRPVRDACSRENMAGLLIPESFFANIPPLIPMDRSRSSVCACLFAVLA